MKTINFKAVDPFFRDVINGLKTFEFRRFDYSDPRHRALVQFKPGRDWRLRLNNPDTKEFVIVHITAVGYLKNGDAMAQPKWLLIWFDSILSFQPALREPVEPPQAATAA